MIISVEYSTIFLNICRIFILMHFLLYKYKYENFLIKIIKNNQDNSRQLLPNPS